MRDPDCFGQSHPLLCQRVAEHLGKTVTRDGEFQEPPLSESAGQKGSLLQTLCAKESAVCTGRTCQARSTAALGKGGQGMLRLQLSPGRLAGGMQVLSV